MRDLVGPQDKSATSLTPASSVHKGQPISFRPGGKLCRASASTRSNKLGLALAGGGFRASLFHLGVLRRMAELDLLRHVDVISTVSGGSIVGALYALYLKLRMDARPNLTRNDYLEIVAETHATLVKAIKKNLRTLLFCNPLGTLRVLLTQHSLGRRMARLYERYIYRPVVDQLIPRRWWQIFRPGKILLREIRTNPGRNRVVAGIETYNANAGLNNASKIPSLILNATSLNSGAPFRFSSVEIGDPRMGSFRFSEIEPEILPMKELLEQVSEEDLRQALNQPTPDVRVGERTFPRLKVLYAAWWRARRKKKPDHPLSGTPLFRIPTFPGALPSAGFGVLRKAKLAAWYYERGPKWNPPVTGGVPAWEHLERFWAALREIDEDLEAALHSCVKRDKTLLRELLEFVLQLYYLRSAEIISPRIMRDLDRLSLGDAVGASACFPPVFPPFTLLGLYDDLWVTKVGLTDGGVYDNVGISTLMEEGCTDIIASDTGGVFDVTQRVSTGRIGMSGRIVSILMDDVAEHQLGALRDCLRVTRALERIAEGAELGDIRSSYELRGLSVFRINSKLPDGPGLTESFDCEVLARMRTDLDVFGDVEIAALENHGYNLADRYLRKHLCDSSYVKPAYWHPATAAPFPLAASDQRIKSVLVAGQSRFFRSLRLNSPVSWIFTLACCGVLVWKTWHLRLSLRDVVGWADERALAWIESQVPMAEPGWTSTAVGVGAALIILAVVVWALVMLKPHLAARAKSQYPKPIRWLLFVLKWFRSYVNNVLWLFGGAPLWIALGAAGVAWISYIFYDLPFLASTRNRAR
jgi:predicted acylesterase/phospholipase RssA